jgi:hypothetical protein
MSELRLNEPQRRAVGIRLRAIGEAVQTLRRAGLDTNSLDAIEHLVAEAAAAAAVSPPLPQLSLVPAMVAEILIAAAEIKPSNLRRYGDINDQTEEQLELLAARLAELADALDVFAPVSSRHSPAT